MHSWDKIGLSLTSNLPFSERLYLHIMYWYGNLRAGDSNSQIKILEGNICHKFFAGEAERLGLETEEDVIAMVKELRKEKRWNNCG